MSHHDPSWGLHFLEDDGTPAKILVMRGAHSTEDRESHIETKIIDNAEKILLLLITVSVKMI